LRRLYRIPAMIALLFGGLATVFLVFPLVGDARREWLIATWSGMLMRACGTQVREFAAPGVQPQTMPSTSSAGKPRPPGLRNATIGWPVAKLLS
jgi:hypothetical protein